MTMCKEWFQPDGDHFNGLCTNEFWPKAGTGGCNVCVFPQAIVPPQCDCDGLSPIGVGLHQIIYIRINADIASIVWPGDQPCYANSLAGDFDLYRNGNFYDSLETTFAYTDDGYFEPCYTAGSIVPGYESYGEVPSRPLYRLQINCNGGRVAGLGVLQVRMVQPGSTGWCWPCPQPFPPFILPPDLDLSAPMNPCADRRFSLNITYRRQIGIGVFEDVVVGTISSHPIP